MSIHFHTLTVIDIRKETSDCVSIAFEVPVELKEAFHFQEGQNLTIRAMINGEELRRSYSICTAPFEKELRVAVKRTEWGKFSNFIHNEVRKGDHLEVLPPTGQFHVRLHPRQKKHYLAFAAGSGITPIISILKSTLFTEPGSRFTLVYGNRKKDSIIFREELEAIKNRYIERFQLIHILSQEVTDIPLNSGRIDAGKCSELVPSLINLSGIDEVFICGPEKMIWSVKNFLEGKGVSREKIHFELFTTPASPAFPGARSAEKNISAPVEGTLEIQIKLDGIITGFRYNNNEKSILNAALEIGLDLPYACKGGVCSTCRAKLEEGEVSMDVNYALSQEELELGFILTCQSHPKTNRVTIDFDAR